MSPRAAVILNPTRVDVTEIRDLLPAIERQHGWEPSLVLETTPVDGGVGQAREAIEAGVDLVIIGGGDGTIRVVIEQLTDAAIPCGLLPAGTGNLLARNLDLDGRRVADSLAIAFGGDDRRIDLARAEVERPGGGRDSFVFTVIAGMGLDAGMVHHTDEDLKKRIGWPAYIGGIAKWMVGSGAFRARYRSGAGRTWGTRASTFMIGNCGMLTGGLVLLPDAKVDDGLLDMVIMRPRGPMGWPMVGAELLSRQIANKTGAPALKRAAAGRRKRPVLTYHQSNEFTIRLDSQSEPFELDGDPAGEIVAAHITALPDALTVRVPRE